MFYALTRTFAYDARLSVSFSNHCRYCMIQNMKHIALQVQFSIHTRPFWVVFWLFPINIWSGIKQPELLYLLSFNLKFLLEGEGGEMNNLNVYKLQKKYFTIMNSFVTSRSHSKEGRRAGTVPVGVLPSTGNPNLGSVDTETGCAVREDFNQSLESVPSYSYKSTMVIQTSIVT